MIPMKHIARPALIAAALLVIPLILQLTIGTGVDGQGFNWKLGDFIVIGILLFVTGLVIEGVVVKVLDPWHRLLAIGVVIFALLLVWAELAVGIIGTPFAGS